MSDIGELAAFARRRGDTWFVAVLNGGAAKPIRNDLGFLGAGRYDALLAFDSADNAAELRIEKKTMTKSVSLAIELRPAGGFIARFATKD